MSKNVVLTLESRFMDEYGEYANLPVFNAHGSIVGYVGGEVPESGNPCEFNRLNDEGFTFCASATEVVRLKAENAKLREQMERLVTLLRADCDIEASWDGLRKFWSIGLTENGCLMRDRACKAEAENAKLREQIHWLKQGDILHVLTDQEYIDQCERERLMQVSIDALDKENAKLRELIRELFRDFANADYELKSRCGRTFMAVTRYLPRLQELEVEP